MQQTKQIEQIKVGDKLPSVVLVEMNDNKEKKEINTDSLTGKVVIFGVPGAFTKPCSENHLPGYLDNADKFKAKGVESVVCVATNDPYVMHAWGKANNADKIRMLSDYKGEFTKALGLVIDLNHLFVGGVRCKRFSVLVEDHVVKLLNVEEDSTKVTCTLADKLLKDL